MSHPLLQHLDTQLAQLFDKGLRRTRRMAQSPCQPHIKVDGRAMLAFNSNDYLGLAAHPAVVQALQEGAALYGAGSGASHLISGHYASHQQLEEALADMQSPHLVSARALYFCTGYMANLGVLTALADSARGDVTFFSESLNHASIIDGLRLTRAPLQIYAHCDADDLDRQLRTCTTATKVVVTDGVFSMDGDIAPLPALLEVCERHGAWLVVDDAHGFGVMGTQGRGILSHFGLQSPQLIYMGTLGKAAGVGGAFVAAHSSFIEWMVQRSRPYIYTTAAAPALAHALLASLRIIQGDEGESRRVHLRALIAEFAQAPMPAGWQRLPSTTAIQPVVIGSNADVLHAAHALQDKGLWITAIRAPTVAEGTARLRITLSAAHSHDDVQQLLNALRDVHA